MKLLCIAALCGMVVAGIIPLSADAADPEFCRDYADSAVRQAEHAMHRRSCEYLIDGSRFSPDFRRHFDWCLNAHRHEADEARESRHDALERCENR